jgi:hypothetical protein
MENESTATLVYQNKSKDLGNLEGNNWDIWKDEHFFPMCYYK